MKVSEATIPGVYRFHNPSTKHTDPWLRKFDGVYWYKGDAVVKTALRGKEKYSNIYRDRGDDKGYQVEIVADIDGNPWTGQVPHVSTQLDLFE